MGAAHSTTTVSVLAEGEQDTPFAVRRCPGFEKGPYQNPPEYQTMQDLQVASFKKFADKPYLGYRKFAKGKYAPEFTFKTYKECEVICKDFASGLKELGIVHKSFLGVYSENSMEWGHAINVSSMYGVCLIALYDTFGLDSLSDLIAHSKMEVLLVSDKSSANLLTILLKEKHNLKKVIISTEDIHSNIATEISNLGLEVYSFDQVLELGRKNPIEKLPKIDPEDYHYVCYSSGTTGVPKGVIISHRSQCNNTLNCYYSLQFDENERHLSYLPLPHVFERIGYSITSMVGGRIGFLSGSVRNLTNDMAILRPTHLSAVPRVITRIYDEVMNKLQKSSSVKRGLFWGLWYWKRFWVSRGYKTPLADVVAFNQIISQTGGCLRQYIVGGASMDPWIHEFVQVATGVPLQAGYGLSEIGAGNICNPLDIRYIKPGTIGGPLCNCEVRLGYVEDYDDPIAGEIQMGGQCLCSGYLFDEQQTAALFTDESRKWIHTGDIGKWDRDGYLTVIDRMRSIFKLAQGEYVAAELISDIFSAAKLVEQIFIYGDSTRSYLVAVVVPSRPQVELFLNRKLTDEEFKAVCEDGKELIPAIKAQLEEIQREKKLPGYERVQKLCLEWDPWTIENDCMTPTFKLKRKKLAERYKEAIDKLYDS